MNNMSQIMKQAKEMPMIEMDTPAPRLGLMAKGE